jgi:aromatic ring-cleaving dioxygenase
MGSAPYHAHIYYSADERGRAERLREDFKNNADILFVDHLSRLKRDMIVRKVVKARRERMGAAVL